MTHELVPRQYACHRNLDILTLTTIYAHKQASISPHIIAYACNINMCHYEITTLYASFFMFVFQFNYSTNHNISTEYFKMLISQPLESRNNQMLFF